MLPRTPRLILLLAAGLSVFVRTVSIRGQVLYTIEDSIKIDPWFAVAVGLLAVIFFAGAKDQDQVTL